MTSHRVRGCTEMQNAPNHFTLCAFHWQNRSGEAKSWENRSGSTARMWQLAPPLESSMCSENWCESKGVSPMTRSFTFPASYAAKSAAIITRTVLLNSHCHRTLNHNEGNTTKIKKECDAFVSCEFLSTPASHAGAARTALGVAKLLRFVQWSAPLNVQGISLNEPCDAGGYLKREITSAGLTRPTFKPMCREKWE